MAVKIRLKRMGKIRVPHYRIVVADSRTKRDGRVIEEIGKYHPKEDPSLIEVDSARAQYWLGVGAQPSEPVLALLKLTGDWQRFKGDASAESTVRLPEGRPEKSDLFNDALKDAHGEPKVEAVTRRRRPSGQPAADTDADGATADAPSAGTQPADSAESEDAAPQAPPPGEASEVPPAGTAADAPAAAEETADAIDSVTAVEVSPSDAATESPDGGPPGSDVAGAAAPE